MEKLDKIHFLVERLHTLAAGNASREQLITATQMLLAELQFCTQTYQSLPNVSVILPGKNPPVFKEERTISEIETSFPQEKEASLPEVIEEKINNVKPIETETIIPPSNNNDLEVSEPQSEQPKEPHPFIRDEFNIWSTYTESYEVPTLVQNKPATTQKERELNESLKQDGIELGQTLQSTPIEDLSAAIGINDRYVYISELFRGDEAMYERSIFTLNKFNNYEQAHTWAERELRLKLGWDMGSEVTVQFEQLIKRRFMIPD
ncbi:hypothetical protein [Arachidicoccus sp.]|jgi:hypothetical protein|uniref:hypothetical protein n=1 Tax=Arachidicoccus sp. TaxID=1872624 RepID=UPI003D21D74D